MNKKDNQVLASLIDKLVRSEKPIWKKVASELAKPRRKKVQVNLSKIEELAEDGSIILVPGKVLGSGAMSKKVNIAAFAFSESAKILIAQAGGKVLSIENLHQTNPKGSGVIIVK